MTDPTPTDPTPTDRTTLRRHPERGHHDAATVHAVLDAGLLCHVGYVIDGRPFVTPTIHWRDGDALYWHGGVGGRMLSFLRAGAEVCVTVSHLDGLVLARSAFHHSANYRSVMAFGTATLVTDDDEKLAQFANLTERMAAGRWADVRRPTRAEIRQTAVARLPLDEVVVKIRDGGVIDAEEDLTHPAWAGVVPARTVYGTPEPDPLLDPSIPLPPGVAALEG